MAAEMKREERKKGTRACVNFLALTCMHIGREPVRNAYRSITNLLFLSGLSTLGYSLYHYIEDMDDFVVVVHHLILLSDIYIAFVHYDLKRATITRLITDLDRYYDYDGLLRAEADRLKEKRDRSNTSVIRLVYFLMVYNYFSIVMIAAAERHLTDKRNVLFPCWFPFDLGSTGASLAAVFIWENAIIVELELGIFSVLVATYLVYGHITDQFKLLYAGLATVRQRALAVTRDQLPNIRPESLEAACRANEIHCTNQCARHHNEIIRYFNDAHSVFKPLFFIIFVTGLVIMIFTGFAAVSDDSFQKIKFITIAITEMIYMFGISWYSEEIAEESMEVGFSAYKDDWSELPPASWSTLRLMMARTMRPLRFTTTAGTEVSLDTYMSVMKASYSYFNMLFAYHEHAQEA